MKKDLLIAKLASRKFWALVVGLAIAIATMIKISPGEIESIIASIGAFGAIVMYMYGESEIDKTRLITEADIEKEKIKAECILKKGS